MVKTQTLYFTWSWIGTGLHQTDRRTELLWLIRGIAMLALTRKNEHV